MAANFQTPNVQANCTSMVLGFLGSGGGSFLTVTVHTLSWQTAESYQYPHSPEKQPSAYLPLHPRVFGASLSPLITSTLSFSTWTLTSAGVAAMALASRTWVRVGALTELSETSHDQQSISRGGAAWHHNKHCEVPQVWLDKSSFPRKRGLHNHRSEHAKEKL